jgi:hypothetical protein
LLATSFATKTTEEFPVDSSVQLSVQGLRETFGLKLVDCCALKNVAVDGGVTVVVELISESDVCSAENTRDVKIVRG